MVSITVDGVDTQVNNGVTIFDACNEAGSKIPTLCYLKDVCNVGSCRVCVVEIEGMDRLVASCNNEVLEGMKIHTNTPRVRSARKTNMHLLLSQHDTSCTTCVRSGNCELQDVSNQLNCLHVPFEKDLAVDKWDYTLPLVRDVNKCIKCTRCIQVCDKIQTMGIWDLTKRSSHTNVGVAGGKSFEESDCTLCGQCIVACPTGALSARDDTQKVLNALADPKIKVLVQVAPAIRTAWGESLGLTREEATVKRLVAALRKMGFDYIFDTIFSADVTIMEEANEFLQRFNEGNLATYPMFTSCCPGWVRFIKSEYPELVPQLSSAKSPQQIFGAIAKTYYAQLIDIKPENIFSVSIMPCVAKKAEIAYEGMDSAQSGQDVDVVLTTREIDRLIRSEFMDVSTLEEEEFDLPLGAGTGAGTIFGTTGGVLEAALRTAYYTVTGENPDPDAFSAVRGQDGWREKTFDINGTEVRTAVASGLGNARNLMDAIVSGEKHFDIVEVMACPGGCAGGGGQPIAGGNPELAYDRGNVLRNLDSKATIRFSHENESVKAMYDDFLGEPNGHIAHELLHSNHFDWSMPHR